MQLCCLYPAVSKEEQEGASRVGTCGEMVIEQRREARRRQCQGQQHASLPIVG
jgi:hypothetical protein